VCVPNIVTVTVTKPAAPPAETHPAPPAETKPTPAVETKPAPSKPVETPAPSKPAEVPEESGDGDSCPKDLNGNYEYPHLIVPVDSEHPDKAYNTSYNGKVSGHTCTIFNFDIPASMAGKKCSTMFMLPKKEDLETSDYTMSGHGKCIISKLQGNADAKTTYNNKPAKVDVVASVELSPGNTYSVESGDCEAGKTVSYMMCGSGDFSMDYFQDWNPSPIGMYVRQC
jgi:outer membrane biosynthesis protein TonB